MADHETEEEIYSVISEALLQLCEQKPNAPVDFLSRKMLELIGDNPELFERKKTDIIEENKKGEKEVIVSAEKLAIDNLYKNFDDLYRIIDKISYNTFTVENIKGEPDLKCARIIEKKNVSLFLSDRKIKMLIELDHPNVIKNYDIIEDENNYYIIHDYCPGKDILTFLYNHKDEVNENIIRTIIQQSLNGLSYLHSKGIVHKNLSPSKILVFKDSINENEIQLKISDFLTNAEFFSKDKFTYQSFNNRIENTLYLAPECFDQKYNNKVDIWSFGIICYLLFTGTVPFKGKDHELLFQISHRKITYPEKLNDVKKSFLQRMLCLNPNDRSEAIALLKDDYFEVNEEELEKGLALLLGGDKKKDYQNVSVMNEIAKFSIGSNLRRSILSYISSKKLYSENNQKIVQLFNTLDVNHDGAIEVDELFKAYRKYFPGTPKQQWKSIEKFIESVDINKNGKIEYSEFLTAMTLQNQEYSEKTLREIFDYYDYTKNGYIDARDLKELFEHTDITDKEIHDMLDEVDKNEDRKISFEEFCHLLGNPVGQNDEEKKNNNNESGETFFENLAKGIQDSQGNNNENENNNNENNENNENEHNDNENNINNENEGNDNENNDNNENEGNDE